MQIGEVIRKYRKEKNMTQEEMARRLGVTAPAVNKWESGASLPDIALLAPIARLLAVTPDTLLSFRDELTPEEINGMVKELDERIRKESFDQGFQYAREKLEQYPNCWKLIYQMALILDANRMAKEIPDTEEEEKYIYDCYVRALNSGEEAVRTQAANSLYGYYMRKEQYDKAEEYLKYLSEQNPERKRKQAELYWKTNRIKEAYREYEQLLFSGSQMLSMVFQGIYLLAMQEHDTEKAHFVIDKQEELARLFELGKYQEASWRLDLAAAEKDADTSIETMEKLLSAIDTLGSFQSSPLYEHLSFGKGLSKEFVEQMRQNLLDCFQDEEAYGFLKGDERWQRLIDGNTAVEKMAEPTS